MSPRYPVFIPSKGRAAHPHTIRTLQRMGVPFHVVVEPQEADAYAEVVDPSRILVTPHRDQGLVVTRNWIWDYARDLGAARFWTFDDNITSVSRWNHNLIVRTSDSAPLEVIEEFTDRYENLIVSGMNYMSFIFRKEPKSPVTLNTRVYSNMLIATNAPSPKGEPYRNEGFYNDDTDLCLRILKDGNCVALFNAFLIDKAQTMSVGGGMTPHYQGDGRYRMARELQIKHPDVTTITRKWGRWQHHVDYSAFRNNQLRPARDLSDLPPVDEFGMVLCERSPSVPVMEQP